MSGMTTAIVLGVHSSFSPHFKTGIQYIAEGLAQRGVAVDYVSVPSSPFDLVGRERRSRLLRVWRHMGRSPVATSMHGLREFAFPSPVPVHASFVRGETMLKSVQFPARHHFASRRYDFCIHDVGPTMAYLPLVQAASHVLRLNDAPRGLGDMPKQLVGMLEQRLGADEYDHVWAVSEPLADLATKAASDTSVTTIPNGFDADIFTLSTDNKKGNKAVYVGSRSPWLDVPLIKRTARLLPEWEFHCVGGGFGGESDTTNLRFLPSVPHEDVPALLSGYDVGLLPYGDDDSHMYCVHRPLKYYEYVAAGLGVASTDVGGLRSGLHDWVRFGRTAEEFALAVEECKPASPPAREAFVQAHAWDVRLAEMFGTLPGFSS